MREGGGAVSREEKARGLGIYRGGRRWRGGGARGGVPDRDSAAAVESATLGTSSRARRRARARWAGLVWPGWLGRPSSAVSLFFLNRGKRKENENKNKTLYRHIIYQNFQKKIFYDMNIFLASIKSTEIKIKQRVLHL